MELKGGYKNTELGSIPNDWNVTHFGSLISKHCYGPRFNANDYSKNGNVKTIRGTDISLKGDIKYEQVPLAKLPATLVKAHKLNDGDLVMITTAECGLTGVYIDDGFPYIASAYAVRITLNTDAHSFFFKYIFQTKQATEQVDLYIRKGTVANLPGSAILKLKFAVPPLTEQRAIAQVLSDTDALIQALEKKITKKKLIKKGVMQELLKPKEGWVRVKLDSEIEVNRGGSPRPIQSYITSSPDGINWIKIGDTSTKSKYIISSKEKIIPEGVQNSRAVNVGDFLLSNSMSFGRPYILKINGCIHDGWLVLQNYQESFDREFLYYSLMSKDVFNQYLAKASGSGVLNLNKELVKTVELNKPKDIKEQIRIAKILCDIDNEIEQLEKKLLKYKQIKQGMMQQLLTGKIRLV